MALERYIRIKADTSEANKAILELDKTTISLGKSAKSTQKDIDAIGSTSKKTSTAIKGLNTQLTKTSTSVSNGLNKNLKVTNSSLQNMSRQSGQAGIQFQQLIGQIQGGVNPMVAISQQAADLGIVLGAPLIGAFAGIAASVAGMLIPSLFKTKEGFRDLTDSILEDFDKLRRVGEAQRLAILQNLKADLLLSQEETRELRNDLAEVKDDLVDINTSQFGEGAFGFLDPLTDKYAKLTDAEKDLKEEQIRLNAEIEAHVQKQIQLQSAIGATERAIKSLAGQPVELGTEKADKAFNGDPEENEESITKWLNEMEKFYLADIDLYLATLKRKDEITEYFENRRVALTNRANEQVSASYQQSASIVLSTLEQLAGSSSAVGKALRLAQGAVAAYTVYSNSQAAASALLLPPPIGLGPLAGAGPAAALATAGKVQAGIVFAAAAANTFGGSSSTTSTPNVSAPSGSSSTQTPTEVNRTLSVENTQLSQLLTELQNFDPDEPLPARFTQRIISSIDNENTLGGG